MTQTIFTLPKDGVRKKVRDSRRGELLGVWLSFFLYIDSLQKTKKNLPFFAKKQKKAKKNFVLIFQLIMPQILYL